MRFRLIEMANLESLSNKGTISVLALVMMLGCKSSATAATTSLISSAYRDRHDDGTSKGIVRELEAPPSQGAILNTITPCAACKLLRRRCTEQCPFSPYFSPQDPNKFASVHKVFGASNVSKMLMDVPESQRFDTASSLVYEANIRLGDPVYGCMGVIATLQRQVQVMEMELNKVRTQFMKMKYRYTNNATVLPTFHAPMAVACRAQSAMPMPTPPPPPPPPNFPHMG